MSIQYNIHYIEYSSCSVVEEGVVTRRADICELTEAMKQLINYMAAPVTES